MAELTGREMVGRVGNAPTWSRRTPALQAEHDLYAANNPKWLRNVESRHDEEAYETSLVLNLPAIRNEVDRRGFAPRSPACEASDLLNDRAAHELMMKW